MNIANWIILIIQTFATIITGSIGYFFKKALTRLEKVEENQRRLEQEMAEKYVRKDDYNRSQGEIMKRLDRIYDILMERKEK